MDENNTNIYKLDVNDEWLTRIATWKYYILHLLLNLSISIPRYFITIVSISYRNWKYDVEAPLFLKPVPYEDITSRWLCSEPCIETIRHDQ